MFERLIPNALSNYHKTSIFDVADMESGWISQERNNPIALDMGLKPDMISTMDKEFGGMHEVCWLNGLGFIPGVSSLSGSYRTLVGLAFFTKCAVSYFFDSKNREMHREGMKIAAANIGRGIIEIIPIVGNLIAANIDVSRMLRRWADFTGKPYGDRRSIPIFDTIDGLGAIPLFGTIVNLARAAFFATHIIVNLPPALLNDKKYYTAMGFGAKQVGIGISESIPVIGSIIYIFRGLRNGAFYRHSC